MKAKIINREEFMEKMLSFQERLETSYIKTKTFFDEKYPQSAVEFIGCGYITKEELVKIVKTALQYDFEQKITYKTYYEWMFLKSVDTMLEYTFECDVYLNDVLWDLGLPEFETMEREYSVADLYKSGEHLKLKIKD